jgi:hypothetical protein
MIGERPLPAGSTFIFCVPVICRNPLKCVYSDEFEQAHRDIYSAFMNHSAAIPEGVAAVSGLLQR